VTGKIRTLRVDKGSGSSRTIRGRSTSSIRVPSTVRDLRIFAKAIVSSSTSAKGPRGLELRTSGALPHNHVGDDPVRARTEDESLGVAWRVIRA